MDGLGPSQFSCNKFINLVEAFPMRSSNIRNAIQKDIDKTVQALSEARGKLQTALEAGTKDSSACSSRSPSIYAVHAYA